MAVFALCVGCNNLCNGNYRTRNNPRDQEMLCEFADFIQTLVNSLTVVGAGLGAIIGFGEYKRYRYSRAEQQLKRFREAYYDERRDNKAAWAAEQQAVLDDLMLLISFADDPKLVQQMAMRMYKDIDGKAIHGMKPTKSTPVDEGAHSADEGKG